MIEKWQEQLLAEAENDCENAEARYRLATLENIARARFVLEMKRRIIANLRSKPEAIFGDNAVYVKSENHLHVHDVSKALNIRLNRRVESDGFNFDGAFNEITVTVYGMTEVPHCRIVARKVIKEVTVYEAVCNGDADAFTDGKIKRVPPQ